MRAPSWFRRSRERVRVVRAYHGCLIPPFVRSVLSRITIITLTLISSTASTTIQLSLSRGQYAPPPTPTPTPAASCCYTQAVSPRG